MYDILKSINDDTFLAVNDGLIYVLKKISIEDTELYKKIQKIDSDYIIKIIEFTIINDFFYVVFEYVNGYNIKQAVEKYGFFDEIKTTEIASQICDGLNELHKAGIIHRDLSASNIMVYEENKIKIIDFDISRILKANVTTDTCILGTQGYAAPEQYGFSQSNERTDIYALGVLINYMLTGAMPNERICKNRLGRIISKCTKIDENSRYSNVLELKSDLVGENVLRKAVRYIPGFFRGFTATSIPAIIYYILAITVEICMVCVGLESAPKGQRYQIPILSFILLFVPIPILGDSGSWTKKWKPTKKLNKCRRFAVRLAVTVTILLVLLAICFITMSD